MCELGTVVSVGGRLRAISKSIFEGSAIRALGSLILVGACLTSGVAWAATASYYYDELGRLIEAVAADGTSVIYTYDAVGNITSVKHDAATAMGIGGFTPTTGAAGTTVTIFGSGFNTTASSNQVTFNGASASVSAATATMLTVTVPAGASTGAISVTNGAASATSSTSFTVASSAAPTISGFTPTIGAQGTAVTITGTNFQSSTSTDKVLFGATAAPVSSATSTTISTSDPTPASSGKISVTTPFGVATSAADFFSVPSGFNLANVQVTSRIAIGGAPLVVTTSDAGKIGLVLFDGARGTAAYLQFTNVTGSGGTFTVFSPDGSRLTSGAIANGLAGLPPCPTTGTYTIVVVPGAPGSLSMLLAQDTTLAMDGAGVSVTSAGSGYNAFLAFSGAAGQNIGLGLSGLTFAGGVAGEVKLSIIQPDGTTASSWVACLASNPAGDCGLALTNLPLTGTYVLAVSDYGGTWPAITGGAVTLSSDVAGTLSSGTAYALSLRQGQNGRLTFAGTAGQPATIRFENITTTPVNQNVAVSILKPDGTTLTTAVNGSSSTNGGSVYVASLPTTGNYAVTAAVAYGAAATMSVTLNPAPELVVDGSAVNITSAATGYGTSLSFQATAGQNLGLGLSGLAFAGGAAGEVKLSIIEPNGTTLSSWVLCLVSNPAGDCGFALTNLPLTGTYVLAVSDYGGTQPAITGGAVTLSSDAAGTLSSGTAFSLSLRQGQNGRLTFAGTAAAHTLTVGVPTTVPSGQTVTVKVIDAGGATVATGSYSTAGGTLTLGTLTAANYTVLVNTAYGASTSMTLTYQ